MLLHPLLSKLKFIALVLFVRYFYLGLNIWGVRSCQIQKPTVCSVAKAKN